VSSDAISVLTNSTAASCTSLSAGVVTVVLCADSRNRGNGKSQWCTGIGQQEANIIVTTGDDHDFVVNLGNGQSISGTAVTQ